MAEFLTTLGTSNHIEKIITEADKEITLVSPYLQISKTLFERLSDASKRDVTIKIIYGKDELKNEQSVRLKSVKNLQLFYFENLHAKCYFNEFDMVITSMNMYEYSEKNNREMGVLANIKKDKKLFTSAVAETISIIQNSEMVFDYKNIETKELNNPDQGCCIRCEVEISFDENRPYCNNCYWTWVQYENPHFQEQFCHSCKSNTKSSMINPFCINCRKELKPPQIY